MLNYSQSFHKLPVIILAPCYIQSVPKLFVQINAGGREHKNKYISLWYIWSLTAISDAGNDLHRRKFSMLIAAEAFTGSARMRDHWSVCTQYMSDHSLSCPFEDSWHVRSVTSSDGNSSDATRSSSVSTTVSYTVLTKKA